MEIPKFLSHLPVHSGFPVPCIVFWQDGKPDFRIVDREKQIDCYKKFLCTICGKVMNRYWFIGGEKSMASGQFTDGPQHRNCAEFSIKICPFLNGTRQEHSKRGLPKPSGDGAIVTMHHVELGRPEKMGLREASEYKLQKYQDSLVYVVSSWRGKAHWF